MRGLPGIQSAQFNSTQAGGALKRPPVLLTLAVCDRAPSRQFAPSFGGSVCLFRQRAANWVSVLVRRFSTSEGTLISTLTAI